MPFSTPRISPYNLRSSLHSACIPLNIRIGAGGYSYGERLTLRIAQSGRDAWNAWRDKNPDIRPDLSDANLSDRVLNGANLSSADLSGANLGEARLLRRTSAGRTSQGDPSHRREPHGANLGGANLAGRTSGVAAL